MKLSDSTILVTIAVITGIGALLTLIGLATPKWSKGGYGLWNCNDVCSSSAAALTILALLFLVISVVLLVTLVIHLFPRKLRIIPLGLLVIATLSLLAAKASYLHHFRLIGYSFKLIVAAHTFTFVASVLLAFWLGRTMNDKAATNITRITVPSA